MRDWGRKLAIGDPPRLITTFLFGIWFVHVLGISALCQFVLLVYQPKEFEPGMKWGYYGFRFHRTHDVAYIVASNFAGRLMAAIVAPLVDRYKILHIFYLASLGSGFIVFLAMAVMALLTSFGLEHEKVMLRDVLPVTMNFFQPFVVAFTVLQFKDKIGAKARMVLTVFYTFQYAAMGICTLAFFPEAPKYPEIVLICILGFSLISATLCLALLIVMWLFVYKHNCIIKGDYQREEASTILLCLVKVLCYLKRGNRFEHLFKVYRTKDVYDAKKLTKVLLILLSMSLLMSSKEFWQAAWVAEYIKLSSRTKFFAKVEFITVTNIMTAFLIPVVQYLLVPQLRKFKLPLPIYSMLMCAGYMCLSVAFIMNILIRWTAQQDLLGPRYNPESNEALYYVFNAMDTYTYVSQEGWPIKVIAPGSLKKLKLQVGKELRVMNYWYDVYYGNRIKSFENDLIICTRQRAYQEYLGDFSWGDGYSASHVTIPKLTFLCQKDEETGGPTDYCNDKTVFSIIKENSTPKVFHMPNNSEPYKTTIELEAGNNYTIQVKFPTKLLNVDEREVSFTAFQGAWYAFVVWSGDVHLKIKYQLVEIKKELKIGSVIAIPQFFLTALGIAMIVVIISCMIHINAPESLTATTWAWYYLLELIFSPIFVILILIGPYETVGLLIEAIVVVIAASFFMLLLAALRVVRYW